MSDKPAGSDAVPQCALSDPAGNKYCVLECLVTSTCGGKATCKGATPAQYGICTYDSR